MPRQNPARTIATERELAARIAYERKDRGLGVEALAKLMTDAGCPINGSAIYRIEKGNPPRAISVNEFVALQKVFGLSHEELLQPVELMRQQRAQDLIARRDPAIDSLTDAVNELLDIYVELFEISLGDPDLYDYVMGHLYPGGADNDEGDPAVLVVDGEARTAPALTEAMTALYQAVIDIAGDEALRVRGIDKTEVED